MWLLCWEGVDVCFEICVFSYVDVSFVKLVRNVRMNDFWFGEIDVTD